MDKNIAAFLDKTAYTISTVFALAPGPSANTYVCNIPGVHVGDWVVVDAPDFNNQLANLRKGMAPMVDLDSYMNESVNTITGIPKLVMVVGVDTEVNIEPNASRAYGWVVAKIDLTNYAATQRRNNQITGLVAAAYKANMRRSFTAQILDGMEGASKDKLLSLLNPTKEGTTS